MSITTVLDATHTNPNPLCAGTLCPAILCSGTAMYADPHGIEDNAAAAANAITATVAFSNAHLLHRLSWLPLLLLSSDIESIVLSVDMYIYGIKM
eukprot:5148996-Ditylum_brightwellii.AAC.1